MAWELFRRDGAGEFEMISVDGDLLADAPVHALPLACEVTIETPSTRPEFLAPTENVIERITEELGGRIAGTSRTATRLWVLVHLPTDEHAARFTLIPLPAKASVSVAPAHDPEWTVFDRLRPMEMEEQSMLDLRVMAGLHAAGDTGGVRTVDHVVTGLAEERTASFIAAVGTIGLTADEPADGTVVLHHAADPSDITADSWTVRLVAERHGATYDGWGCEVVGAEPSTPRTRKRKWFRR
jgi:hypothetical protein